MDRRDHLPAPRRLFTDIVMPGGVDGRQLAQQARRRGPGIGILLTSGDMAPAAVVPLAADEHGERLLSKPYELVAMARAARAALDARPHPV